MMYVCRHRQQTGVLGVLVTERIEGGDEYWVAMPNALGRGGVGRYQGWNVFESAWRMGVQENGWLLNIGEWE